MSYGWAVARGGHISVYTEPGFSLEPLIWACRERSLFLGSERFRRLGHKSGSFLTRPRPTLRCSERSGKRVVDVDLLNCRTPGGAVQAGKPDGTALAFQSVFTARVCVVGGKRPSRRSGDEFHMCVALVAGVEARGPPRGASWPSAHSSRLIATNGAQETRRR